LPREINILVDKKSRSISRVLYPPAGGCSLFISSRYY